MTQFDSMHAAAVAYVARGWKIIPLHFIRPGTSRCSCDQPGCKAAGKHPRGKAWQESTGWAPEFWRGGQLENIGILTGSPSGFWVLDYDPADAALGDLGARLHEEGYHPHVRTGGGGYHYRFLLPDDFEVRNRQSAGGGAGRTHSLPAGWDVRGEGGQVVAPPSVSAKGQYVELTGDWWLSHVPPAWLLDMIRPPDHMVSTAGRIEGLPQPGGLGSGSKHGAGEGSSHPAVSVQAYATAALRAEIDTYSSLTDGRRGEAAFSFGCSLVEIANLAGWPHEQVWPHYEQALEWAAGNAGGGGYASHERLAQWERARAQVGSRAREMPPPPDVLPGVTSPFPPAPEPGAVDGMPTIIEPGWNGAASNGVNGAAPATGPMPAPNLPPAPPPPGMPSTVWNKIQTTLEWDAAKRYIADLALGDRASAVEHLRAEIIDAAGMRARPRLKPIVPGLLYRNSLARIIGSSGHGKSFVVLDLGAHIGAGAAWAGRPVTQGRVLWLVAEGDEGVPARVEAWETHNGRKLEGVSFLPRPVNVYGPEWSVFVEAVAGVGFDVIFLDTQARITPGADEIDRAEQSELVEACDALRVATGACVVLVHHRGSKGAHARGHTEVFGALQTQVYVERAGNALVVGARAENGGKVKDDREPADIRFKMVEVPVGLPDESGIVEPGQTSIALEWEGDASVAVDGEVKETKAQRQMRWLWRHIFESHNHGEGGTRADIRIAFYDEHYAGKSTGTSRDAWRAAWQGLISLGLVAKRWKGDYFKVIVRADQSAAGVLTPNHDGAGRVPEGFDLWTFMQESDSA